MLKKCTLSFCVTLLLACSSTSNEVPWKKMIIAPSEENYSFAETQLIKNPACDTGWYSDEKFYNDLYSLIKMVRDGNVYAFKIGTMISKCVDGGALGDLHRAMGVFYEDNPQVFFEVAHDSKKTKEELKSMIIIIPLETTDNFPLQINTLRKRLAILSSFKEKLSSETYEYLYEALNTRVDFIQSLYDYY